MGPAGPIGRTAPGAGRPVAGVLLDVDDTLVDTRAAFRTAILAALDTWLPDLPADRREPAVLRWAQDPGGYFRAYTRGELTMQQQRALRVADLHRELGAPQLSADELASWVRGYEAAFEAAWRLMPGAVDLLDELAAAGLPVGAVTNASRALQTGKLARVGLLDRLPLLACVDDVGRGKPDPAMWHRACDRLGLPPGRVAYLGDELDVDARGARDAGLLGIWFDRHGTGHDPGDVPVLRALGELPALLRDAGA
jgi:putative hydrolase of the HAD superfamily